MCTFSLYIIIERMCRNSEFIIFYLKNTVFLILLKNNNPTLLDKSWTEVAYSIRLNTIYFRRVYLGGHIHGGSGDERRRKGTECS